MDDSAPLEEKIVAPTDPQKITWIDVIGLQDVETISAIGENFGIATLVLHDHSIQAEETISDLRDASNSLRDYYHTVVSNRMNEVMKVLTALSTIFLPLTFLAGIYGMNFEHMPELGKKSAYPVFWCVSLLIAAALFTVFKRKKWL